MCLRHTLYLSVPPSILLSSDVERLWTADNRRPALRIKASDAREDERGMRGGHRAGAFGEEGKKEGEMEAEG